MALLTHPLMKRYAACHGLKFIVLRDRSSEGLPAHYAKYQIRGLLNEFDRIVFVDTDILVHPCAPSLLEIVPPSHFGAYLASEHSDVHDEAVVAIQNRLGDVGWGREYFNSGVMVISHDHAKIFDTALGTEISFWEQTQLNYNVRTLSIPLFDIGYPFNHVQAAGEPPRRMDSYFIHYAGPGHRMGPKPVQIAEDLLCFAQERDDWWQEVVKILPAITKVLGAAEYVWTTEIERIYARLLEDAQPI